MQVVQFAGQFTHVPDDRYWLVLQAHVFVAVVNVNVEVQLVHAPVQAAQSTQLAGQL